MGNMSYCRFENTAQDLEDCYNALYEGDVDDMSEYEIEGLKDVLKYSQYISEMEGKIANIIKDREKEIEELECE